MGFFKDILKFPGKIATEITHGIGNAAQTFGQYAVGMVGTVANSPLGASAGASLGPALTGGIGGAGGLGGLLTGGAGQPGADANIDFLNGIIESLFPKKVNAEGLAPKPSPWLAVIAIISVIGIIILIAKPKRRRRK